MRWPAIVPIHGLWTGQAPGANGEIETGTNFAAGVLNGTFVTLLEEFEGTSANGSFIIHHKDVISSSTFKHREGGALVPDTITTDLTVVVIQENGQYRSTFLGTFSKGTGIFTDAQGYYLGEGTSGPPPRGTTPAPGVTYYSGTIGGEIRLPLGT